MTLPFEPRLSSTLATVPWISTMRGVDVFSALLCPRAGVKAKTWSNAIKNPVQSHRQAFGLVTAAMPQGTVAVRAHAVTAPFLERLARRMWS
jgi:hypothetical protein